MTGFDQDLAMSMTNHLRPERSERSVAGWPDSCSGAAWSGVPRNSRVWVSVCHSVPSENLL